MLDQAPSCDCVCWGIPFHVEGALFVKEREIKLSLKPTKAKWLVFLHATDIAAADPQDDGFFSGRHRENLRPNR